MKKTKLLRTIASALIMVMLLSVTSFADTTEGNYWNFDLEALQLDLAPGDVYPFHIRIEDGLAYRNGEPQHKTYSMYMVGNNDPQSYAWSDFKTGNSICDIHIGPNETSKRITVHFYVDETDIHDCVDINIVPAEYSALQETRVKAYKAKQAATAVPAVAQTPAVSIKDVKFPSDEEIAKMDVKDQLYWYYLAVQYKQQVGK